MARVSYSSRATLKKRDKKVGLTAGHKAGLCKLHGLEAGMELVQGGQRFVFSRVGGISADRKKPWVWAYKTFKNGKLYADPTRLDRWEKV